MLEADGKLSTWRLLEYPERNRWLPAERLPDHRIDYLEYEGEVSGGRGRVNRIVAGTWLRDESLSAPDAENVEMLEIHIADSALGTKAIFDNSDPTQPRWRFE